MLGAATGMQAQKRDIPALQINFKDGTADTIFNTNTILGNDMKMYGVNDATGDDYVTLGGCWLHPNNIDLKYGRTFYGVEANPSSIGFSGLIFSEEHINDDVAIPLGNLDVFWLVNKETGLSSRQVNMWTLGYSRCIIGLLDTLLVPGRTYYYRGYYVLDDKVYLTSEKSERVWKNIEDMQMAYGLSFAVNDGNMAVVVDYDEARQRLTELYGESSILYNSLMDEKMRTFTEEQVKAMAYKTEECDDGNIYFVDFQDSWVDEIIARIEAEANETFYIQANEQTLLPMTNSKAEFGIFHLSGYYPEIVTCDEKWGVRDNQYVTTSVPPNSSVAPTLGIRLNHIMLPGKEYNITFSIAPQTEESVIDTLAANIYVAVQDGSGVSLEKDTYLPYVRMGNPYSGFSKYIDGWALQNIDGLGVVYVAPSDAVTTFTGKYTPKALVYSHAFEIFHTVSSFLASTKRKQSQNIRLIGVEVSPAQ